MNKVPIQGSRKAVLLHGPARVASRSKLLDLKQKFDPNNVVVFEEGATNKDIIDNLMSNSLFADERLVILENPDENFVLDSSLHTSHLSLILWFDHEVSEKKPVMEWVKKSQGQVFYFPEAKEVSVFPFLDFLANEDKRAFLELQKLKNAGFDIYYFITMVFYLLRNLAATPKNAPNFVKQKLERQRKNFNLERTTKLYKDTLETDLKLKSGLIESQQAEFVLVNKFMG